MKKICFIIKSLGGGGAERVALNLLNSLDLKKFKPYIILTNSKGNYYSELGKEISVSVLNIQRSRYTLKALKSELKKINPDIVLTFSIELNTIVGLFIAPFFKKKMSFISREINVLSKVKLGFLRKFLLKLAYKNSSKIISQSDDMTLDLKQYLNINSDKIYQISNPIDCDKIKEKLNEKNPFENSKFKNILCVGRLENQKGFDILIKSFAKLKNQNFILNILGEGSQRKYLEQLCFENNISHKVKFLGFQKNPYIYMKYSDLFILSSRFEGFPNALLEATYCGLYSIANDCKGGIKEIILDEINGKIINIENYIELEKALSSFETKKVDRKEISKITENKYSTKIIVQRYEKLFEEILKNREKIMKTYLITGGAGFIGSTLSERILKDCNRVIALDNFNDFYDYKIKLNNVLEVNNKELEFNSDDKETNIKELKKLVDSENYTLEYVDIRDLKELERVFTENKIDTVIHLAGLGGVRPSIEDPLLYEEVNVRGTNNIFEVMRRTGVKKILAASSSSVYGNNESVPFKETDIVDFAISPYAASKKSNEVLAHTYHHLFNIDVVMLRFFTVFGPRQRPDLAIYKFTKLIDEDKEIPFFGDGSTSRDYTYVDDIVKGVMLLANYVENSSNVYEISNIGGSDPVSLKEMVEIIEEVLGKKAKINRLPMQPGDVNRTYADLTKIKNLVGYEADNTFKQGIEKFVKWYFEKGKNEK